MLWEHMIAPAKDLLDQLDACVLDDVAVTSKLADPAIRWYEDQHREMEAKLTRIAVLCEEAEQGAPTLAGETYASARTSLIRAVLSGRV